MTVVRSLKGIYTMEASKNVEELQEIYEKLDEAGKAEMTVILLEQEKAEKNQKKSSRKNRE